MIKFILTTAIISTASFSAMAQMPENTSTRVMMASKMDCTELTSEMERLNSIVTAAGGAKTSDTLMGGAAAAGTQAAIMSGAGSSIPFVGGFLNAAKSVTSANAESKAEMASEAKNEISRLSGIAEVKGCM